MAAKRPIPHPIMERTVASLFAQVSDLQHFFFLGGGFVSSEKLTVEIARMQEKKRILFMGLASFPLSVIL